MGKKLLVKVPQTKDGRNLAYDSNKQPVYTEHIVELAAKKHYQSLNAKLPQELKYILEEVDEAGEPQDVSGLISNELQKKDEELQAKDLEIEKLKAALENVKEDANVDVQNETVPAKGVKPKEEKK